MKALSIFFVVLCAVGMPNVAAADEPPAVRIRNGGKCLAGLRMPNHNIRITAIIAHHPNNSTLRVECDDGVWGRASEIPLDSFERNIKQDEWPGLEHSSRTYQPEPFFFDLPGSTYGCVATLLRGDKILRSTPITVIATR